MISFTLVLAVGVRLIIISGPPPRQSARESLPNQSIRKVTRLHLRESRCRSFQETCFPLALRQPELLHLQLDAPMRHKVTLLPGEGIGPEVSRATRRILEAAGVQIDWEEIDARAAAGSADAGIVLNEKAVESVRRNGVGLKGPMATAVAGGARSVNVALRKTLDLYANLRPVKNLPGLKSRFENIDLVIVRENTEDLYSGLEHEVVPGVVESLKIITEKASTRIARFAFEYARKNNRKKIHAIHKANIMKLSDGLFLRCARNVAKDYPEVVYGEHIVDNTCMQLVMNPG